MSAARRLTAIATAATLLSGCALFAPEEATPAGYHQMPDGTLMADVVMTTEYRDVMGDGVLLPTHTLPDGSIVLGAAPAPGEGHHAGHEGHPAASPEDFPDGIVPVAVEIPRLGLQAPVVATQMDSERIGGPPLAGDLAWLEQTRRPGEFGPAIIGGVREIDGEPGAFARLHELQPGDEFAVLGQDGALLAFTVDSVTEHPTDDRFPVFEVREGRPEVRLVAWGLEDGEPDLVVSAFGTPDADDAS